MEALLEKQPKPEKRVIDEYERRYNGATTLAAEMLDGSMQTSFEYDFYEQELYASDGSSIGGIFNNAYADAYKIAAREPRLACEIRRRGEACELGEYKDMIAMARGEGPNTMIVTSDPPPELDEWGQDLGGYNSKRRQTMLRVISRLPNGKIRITSQTLDKSDRDGLEAVHSSLGFRTEKGELLGRRRKVNLKPQEQDALPAELTRVYDESLEEKFGGHYYAGRTPADGDNTYQFVCNQPELVHEFIQGDMGDQSLLGFIAALDNRWNQRKVYQDGKTVKIVGLPAGLTADREMQMMANWAAEQGKTYSGCGVTITGQSEMGALGYGNKSSVDSDGDCEFISKTCPSCGEKNVKTRVTKHKITGSCGCSKHK